MQKLRGVGLTCRHLHYGHQKTQDLNPGLSSLIPPSLLREPCGLGGPALRELDGSLEVSMAASDSYTQ